MSPSKALVDFIASSQLPHDRPLNAYPLQRHLSTPTSKSISDPVAYIHHILSTASTPSLTDSFSVSHTYHSVCQICKGLKNSMTFAHSTFIPPQISNKSPFLTSLSPTFSIREINYAKLAVRTLVQLLATKASTPERTSCSKCALPNSSNMRKPWRGFAYAPENLIFSFDRSGAKKNTVDLSLEHDFSGYVNAKKEKTVYRLAAVVKRLRSGIYAAFVCNEEGAWCRCINGEVKRCEGEWMGGEVVLGVHERIEQGS